MNKKGAEDLYAKDPNRNVLKRQILINFNIFHQEISLPNFPAKFKISNPDYAIDNVLVVHVYFGSI